MNDLQLSLLDLAPTVQTASTGGTLKEQFEAFHEANGHVYESLRTLAYRYKARGNTKCGIGSLYEVLRWEYAMQTDDPEFKINNNHRAFYARMLMERNPDLDGFFELRTQRCSGIEE